MDAMNTTQETQEIPEKTQAELDALKLCPEAQAAARLVGAWIWAEFPSKPSPDTLTFLKARGYRFNPKRKVWQNACGVFTRRAPYDPREKYGVLKVESLG
jgi:hypothetical protein